MRALICKLIGHRWSPFQLTIGGTRLLACSRCGHVHSIPVVRTSAGAGITIELGDDA